MAHFAQLDENNVVTQVIVVSNDVTKDTNGVEVEEIGIAFCKKLFGDDTNWKQTSYNQKFRNIYAGPGSLYLEDLDVFVPAQPYPSWNLNRETLDWDPPIPYPENYDCLVDEWNEDLQKWDK